MSEPLPDCRNCQHFHVTWDNQAPQGCKKFGFKAKHSPSLEVLASSGRQCTYFQAKDGVFCFPTTHVLPENCTFSITG